MLDSREPKRARRTWKPLVLWAVSVLLLIVLYSAADWRQVGGALTRIRWAPFVAALALFVPQTLVSAWRWRLLIASIQSVSLAESLRQTLAASALNLVFPSKMGDFSKAAMCGKLHWKPIAARAVWEKALDVAALVSCGLLALLAEPGLALLLGLIAVLLLYHGGDAWRSSATGKTAACWPGAVGASLALWSLHLLQISLMLHSMGAAVPWHESFARVPCAIFAGLVPVSAWGIGTRDAALVWMFSDLAPASQVAAAGLLTALRYLLPGLAGIPFLSGYLARWSQAAPSASGDSSSLPASKTPAAGSGVPSRL
ncbi:MAG: flippase-like domain-containing protein [Planctomycetales bacterium]